MSTSATSSDVASSTSDSRPSGTPPNQGGGGNGNQFGSSTASNLYLYTFLATLVLLLFVSGAVIARSITLRVRARRAIEESIRNGTYVPPPPGSVGPNVSKPRFHDARIKESYDSAFADEKKGRWNDLTPISTSFVPSKSPRAPPRPANSSPQGNRSLLSRLRVPIMNPFRTVQIQDILDELASRDIETRLALQRPQQPSQAELAAAAFGTRSNPDESLAQGEVDQPSAVRVAVLIAMPDPAHPTNVGVNGDAHLHSSSSISSLSEKGKSAAPGSDAVQSDDEPELPYVEFGVAEVPFMPSPSNIPPPPAASSPM